MRERPAAALILAAGLCLVPIVLLQLVGSNIIHPPGWLHFVGVGLTAAVITGAAVLLTRAGAAEADGRAVVVGTGFAVMAALLALHGLTTPGVILGDNGVVAFTGGATLPAGAAILVLAALPGMQSPRVVKPMLRVLVVSVVGILVLGLLAIVAPSVVPSIPEPRSAAAWVVLGIGLMLLLVLLARAAKTYRLTRRPGDLSVAVGIVWLGAALVPSLAFGWWHLGWWLGHAFELIGIALVGVPVALDLKRVRGQRSLPLVGDLDTIQLVHEAEAFLGSQVRAMLAALAAKDTSTEEHTRRVALLGVQIGKDLGLPPGRLRTLALGGLLHDIGKLSTPDAILKKPAPLTDEEFREIERHAEAGMRIVQELGQTSRAVISAVRDHHERLDGSGYPHGVTGEALSLEARILAVCDVYDALVSHRVYRPAWPHARAMAFMAEQAGVEFDPRVVASLNRVLSRDAAEVLVA